MRTRPASVAQSAAERIRGRAPAGVQRRQRPEQQRRQQRQQRGEGEDRRVNRDLVNPGDALQSQTLERGDGPVGEDHPGCPSQQPEQQALDQRLPDQPRRGGAQGRAHRQIALARGGARQEQVGQVRAGHQQQQPHGGEEREQRRFHPFDHVLVQRHGADAQPRLGVHQVFRAQLPGQRVHLLLELGLGDAGPPPGEDGIEGVVARDGEHVGLIRGPEIGLVEDEVLRRQHQPEPLAQDPDHGAGLPVEEDRAADQRGIGGESPRPEPVREDDHAGTVLHRLLRGEEPAQQGPGAEHGQQIRARRPDLDQLGITLRAVEVGAGGGGGGEVGHLPGPRAVIEEVRPGDSRKRLALPEVVPDDRQVLGVGIGERFEQHGAHHAEDR